MCNEGLFSRRTGNNVLLLGPPGTLEHRWHMVDEVGVALEDGSDRVDLGRIMIWKGDKNPF